MRKATRFLASVALVSGACLCVYPTMSSDDPVADEVKTSGDHERGEGLYNRYCRGCHGEEGKGDALTFQPHVDNLSKKGYIDHLPDSYLLLAITKGGRGIGKSNVMPSWEGTLSRQQMLDIIAYVRSLPLN